MRTLEDIRRLVTQWLARRDYSCYELTVKLQQKNIDPLLIEDAMTGLLQEGWVNDERFSENYIYSRIQKGYGPHRILSELKSKGIAQDILDKLIHCSDACWLDVILHLKQKHFKHPTNTQEEHKQIRFFLNRGFDQEQIETIIKMENSYAP